MVRHCNLEGPACDLPYDTSRYFSVIIVLLAACGIEPSPPRETARVEAEPAAKEPAEPSLGGDYDAVFVPTGDATCAPIKWAGGQEAWRPLRSTERVTGWHLGIGGVARGRPAAPTGAGGPASEPESYGIGRAAGGSGGDQLRPRLPGWL